MLAHSRTAGIRADELLDGGQHTLYLSATAREQRRLRPVFVALIESVIEEAYRRSAATGRPLDPPLLVVLDEAANIAPLPDLDVIAATGAGHGVQLVTVLQDLAQAHERWGRDRADTIVNNHRARVIAGGAADERTLDYVNRLLGDTEVRQHSSTTGEPGRRSTTISSGYRPLAPANVVREAAARLRAAALRQPPASLDQVPAVVSRPVIGCKRGRRRIALERVARERADHALRSRRIGRSGRRREAELPRRRSSASRFSMQRTRCRARRPSRRRQRRRGAPLAESRLRAARARPRARREPLVACRPASPTSMAISCARLRRSAPSSSSSGVRRDARRDLVARAVDRADHVQAVA